MIFYGKQNVNQQDIQAVIDVLRSDFLTQGPAIEMFEKRVAEYCGVKYAVAVTNATAALHIACLAAGLKKGDVLWTSPNTFVASANCGRYCGADVDFVDIDNDTYNMSVDTLAEKLAEAQVKPKVVIPVHFSGQSCEMERIYTLSKQYGFIVIEDASHAIGADYQDTKVGSCKYSDMTVFSFHPVKIITTGEGGMVLTNSEALYQKLQLLRSHGITRDESMLQGESDGPWYYQQIDLGFNYRMTDMQAALGYSQMDRLDEFIARRRYLADRYNELLKGLPLTLPYQSSETNSSWHIYVVRLDLTKVKLSKENIFARMREKGIMLNLHYIPVHTQPYYQQLGFKIGDFPNSEQYYKEVFTLPLYYGLTDEQQDEVVKALQEVFQ
ncbi:UDP-4-amino-4,6-dideoxy-N-acetyl-beta-L-altrosamine transaminase [Sporomusa sphaeroides]|uniref:UDP-4-amino-4-deoxy-L-arabinose--oxoglutarate aminotransferase n=1 Tax=Sporomusa sphaeroides DSM 2875 TaxID=1337886 RepID=A0ABM9W6P8_9FIRM|nr:UDP-4-amino-4,6-dideoxy-N-acetyl-beta-L-altrosamine transaminase [Sporomusa sphaeroides]OLS55574.1 UDP-4-amino-4-deoxy-L-arabinose--oxoglutarate aminotransferase [Sporomusa sphaeroides DSM 2875]CVK19889.1 UDP-4-amino-4-deoxy-L-arabinose--oxoglutarate aminotransferase [Sporomusa sphaeroides DSM 2875]